ncbi:hypothetical protein Tco_1278940, partial [Tanacetum coccineum]
MEPTNTFLIGDEVISTIPTKETDEFIKSSIDDLVPIPREYEVTSNSNLECDIPATTPLPPTDVREEYFDINSPLGEYVENIWTPSQWRNLLLGEHLEELECLLADDPVPVLRVFDEPLGNFDSISRSSETSDLFEELIVQFGLDDSIPIEIDDRYHESEGDILYFEQLLNEDTSSDVSLALLPTESSSLDLPLLDPKHICLRKVERFDLFFSLTQSGEKTKVMKTPSFGFHHMPSPRPAAYSPTKVMIPSDREDLRACFQSSNHL